MSLTEKEAEEKKGSNHFGSGQPSGRRAELSCQREDTGFLGAGGVRLWGRTKKGLGKRG